MWRAKLLQRNDQLVWPRIVLAGVAIRQQDQAALMEQLMFANGDEMRMSDTILFLAHHGTHLAQTGEITEAEKIWGFCVDRSVESGHKAPCSVCLTHALEADLGPNGFQSQWWPVWLDSLETWSNAQSEQPFVRRYFKALLLKMKSQMAAQRGETENAAAFLQQLKALGKGEPAFKRLE